MLTSFRISALKAAMAGVALGALVPLAACNRAIPEQASVSPGLPDLPATLPLALGDERPVTAAPAAEELPRTRQIKAARVADPDEYYAYADDAWSYYDALGDAPPDYGFYYDGVEPWGWQGYDDSLMFVEPLDAGYRYYYYRPGEEYPYFVRDPYYGYGYDDGLLAVVYDALGGIVPYDDYYDYPYLDYASGYYDRGYNLYLASHTRHPVIAANWYAVQPAYSIAFIDWEDDLWRQPDWWDYHERTYDSRSSYWDQERARREAESVRFAAWQDMGFQAAPPPRAIPRNWRRADWARDERWYAPAYSGFDGNSAEEQRAARRERLRVASLTSDVSAQDRVQLAELRQRAPRRVDVEQRRAERMAARQNRLEQRQVRLASRQDREALQERAVLQRQERALASVQQADLRRGEADLRRNRGAERQQLAGADRRQLREAAREQRLNQVERGRQDRLARNDGELRRQAAGEARRQRVDREQTPQAAQQQRAQRDEARQAARQQRAQRDEARQAAQQQRDQRDQARQAAQQQRAQRDEARQAARQQRAQRDEARQAAQQQRAQRDQARQAAQQQRAQRDEARQAAQQQRAQRDQARQAAQQQRAQRDQARQAAQQQRAAQVQARQAADQQRASQAEARQAAQQQERAAREQGRQAVQQQRAAQASAAQASGDGPGKERRGRGNN